MTNLAFILTGFSLVIVVLSFLWLVCVLIGWLHKDRRGFVSREIAPAGPVVEPAIPIAHLVTISAALATIIKGPHRIVRVYAPGHRSTGWIEQERLQPTHRVRWDWAVPGPTDAKRYNPTLEPRE